MSLALTQRPFFVIGHMVNSIRDVDSFLKRGANAIEADIQFKGDGSVTDTHHGFPCDCLRKCSAREMFTKYLDYVRNVTSLDGSKFKGKMKFIYLDLKTYGIKKGNQHQAGVDIARKLIQHLWKNVLPNNAMNVVVSIRSPKDKDIFRGVLDTIRHDPKSKDWKEHIGFAFDPFSNISEISKVFSENGIVEHRWLGSGFTNCAPDPAAYRLTNIVNCRDGEKSGCDYVDKGFTWTLDKKSSIAKAIKRGLDAVMTNHPEAALAVMKRKDLAPLVRLAGPQDSPWKRIVSHRV